MQSPKNPESKLKNIIIHLTAMLIEIIPGNLIKRFIKMSFSVE